MNLRYFIMKKVTPWPEYARELYRPSDRRLSGKLVPTFADERCHVFRVTDPYSRNLGFLDRSRYFSFKVAPQLYSRGWVDPVPDPLLLRELGSGGNRTRPLDLQPGTLTTRPQRRFTFFYITYKFSSYLTGNTTHLRSVARNSDH
jgi:hypothetical protein